MIAAGASGLSDRRPAAMFRSNDLAQGRIHRSRGLESRGDVVRQQDKICSLSELPSEFVPNAFAEIKLAIDRIARSDGPTVHHIDPTLCARPCAHS
jgi:hypothetical protein